MAKPRPTNDSLIRQLREWNRVRLEANANRAAIAVVRMLPAKQRTMKRATEIRDAIPQAFKTPVSEVRG